MSFRLFPGLKKKLEISFFTYRFPGQLLLRL
jgi:hypothetical protein